MLGWLVVALVAMMASVYVPHHHHSDSACLGSTDCTASHHSHQDKCGGEDTHGICCSDADFLDSKSVDSDDFTPLSLDNLLAVVWVMSGLPAPLEEKSYIENRSSAPPFHPFIEYKSLRSPPV